MFSLIRALIVSRHASGVSSVCLVYSWNSMDGTVTPLASVTLKDFTAAVTDAVAKGKFEYSADDCGQYLPGGETRVPFQGAILPLSERDLRNLPQGTYTAETKKLYTNGYALAVGAKVEGKSKPKAHTALPLATGIATPDGAILGDDEALDLAELARAGLFFCTQASTSCTTPGLWSLKSCTIIDTHRARFDT